MSRVGEGPGKGYAAVHQDRDGQEPMRIAVSGPQRKVYQAVGGYDVA
jgi:hypothetical protein